ncbi:MAG: helix-turn-helix domain-containing protein [Methanomicrobiaceae archaeon]|nr:helix-turn-helix domain-containing protein [Methanomicrobiaceae archaeon]
MTEDVVILEPGDERAKKIARAMASKTASDILVFMKEGEYSSSQISEALSLPITTVTYHLDKLSSAGIIDVVRMRWSEKGREMKIYGLRDQLVIVSPATKDIHSILLKYASLFAILIFASFMMVAVAPLIAPGGLLPGAPDLEKTLQSPSNGFGIAQEDGALRAPAGEFPVPIHDLVLAFFSGGCLILLLLITYELYLYRRK